MALFGNQRVLFLLLAGFISTIGTAPTRAGEIDTVDPESAGFDTQQLAKIKAEMQGHIDDGQLVGGMALVARDDKVVFAETWGMRDREEQEPMTDDTIFRIYSMTKPVTSVAAMMLVEQGNLELDAPISRYLPEMAHPKVLVKTDVLGRIIEVASDQTLAVYMVRISPTGKFDYADDVKRMVYAAMEQ